MDPIIPPKWMPSGIPYWNGFAVFGDPSQFGSALFNATAAQADAFTGNAPGTTAYSPGRAIAITGVLTGPDTATVQADVNTLAALATPPATGTARLVANTGLAGLPHRGWDAWGDCWFSPTDLATDPAGIVAAPTGGYQLAYRLIVRCGPLIQSGADRGHKTPEQYLIPWDGHTPENPYVP